MKRHLLRWAGFGVVVNWLAYFGLVVGRYGDAPSGKAEGGRFFLGNHGSYLEVSHRAWVLSAIWTYVTFSSLLALILVALWQWRKVR